MDFSSFLNSGVNCPFTSFLGFFVVVVVVVVVGLGGFEIFYKQYVAKYVVVESFTLHLLCCMAI